MMPLREVLDIYAPVKGICDRTLTLYGFTLRAFGEYLGECEGSGYRDPTTADLEQLTVAKFLAWRLRNRAAATASKDRAQLRALWAWAWDEQIAGVSKGPSIRRINVPERIPEAWLTEEMRRLVESAAMEPGTIEGIPAGEWWRVLLLVAYESGERITSLLSLRFADAKGGLVIFRADARKGQRRDIARPLSPETAMAIDSIALPQRDLVFPWPRAVSTLYHYLGRILTRAGLPTDRRCKFHRIRKTSASYYEAGGGDAQVLLDHSSPTLKRKHYLDPRITGGDTDAPNRLPKVG